MKKCKTCLIDKSLDAYEAYAIKGSMCQYRHSCKACRAMSAKKQLANKPFCRLPTCYEPQKSKELCEKHYKRLYKTGSILLPWETDDPSLKICKECSEIKSIDDFYKNRHTCKLCISLESRARKLSTAYNLTVEDYQSIFDKQDGKCAICMTSVLDVTRILVVDHCHDSGTVRGLLCDNCNLGLGNFKDNIETLQQAIIYLTERVSI